MLTKKKAAGQGTRFFLFALAAALKKYL